MTRSLTFKLVLAFLLVSLTGAALTILFARWTTVREFDRLVLEQVQTSFLADATAYYQANGSWQGVLEHFPIRRRLLRPHAATDPANRRTVPPWETGRAAAAAPSYIFALADPNGQRGAACWFLSARRPSPS